MPRRVIKNGVKFAIEYLAQRREGVASIVEFLERMEAAAALDGQVPSRRAIERHLQKLGYFDDDAMWTVEDADSADAVIVAAVLRDLIHWSEGRITQLTRGEAKWIIGHCDWFCATRMHAAIAALSSGVPSAAVAYSRKAVGVFETCGQEEYVIDARRADATDIVNHLWWAYQKRDVSRERLAKALPDIRRRAQEPLDEIVGWCQRFRHRGAA